MVDPARADAVQRLRAGLARLWARRGELREPDSRVAVALGLVLVVAGAVIFGAVLDAVAERDDLAEADQPVLEGLAAARSEPVTRVLTAVSLVTGPAVLPVIVLAAAVVWGLRARSWWQPVLLAGAMLGSTALSLTFKAVVARPRPPLDAMSVPGSESTYSFPSGHTVGTATFLLVAGYLLWIRRPRARSLAVWVGAAVLGIALVAGSRLYLGYHFVTDVVAGASVGLAVLGVVVVVDRRRAVRAARLTGAPGPGGDAGAEPAR